MGRKVVSIQDFNHALELLQEPRNQLKFLISEQLDFVEQWKRYMTQVATALSWVKTLDFWINKLRDITEEKR